MSNKYCKWWNRRLSNEQIEEIILAFHGPFDADYEDITVDEHRAILMARQEEIHRLEKLVTKRFYHANRVLYGNPKISFFDSDSGIIVCKTKDLDENVEIYSMINNFITPPFEQYWMLQYIGDFLHLVHPKVVEKLLINPFGREIEPDAIYIPGFTNVLEDDFSKEISYDVDVDDRGYLKPWDLVTNPNAIFSYL